MNRSGAVKYNLTCSTDDARIADWIADQLVKQIGTDAISAKGISVNSEATIMTVINDPLTNPPYTVLDLSRALARRLGVEIVEADIVGKIPLSVILASAGYALSVPRIKPSQVQCEKEQFLQVENC